MKKGKLDVRALDRSVLRFFFRQREREQLVRDGVCVGAERTAVSVKTMNYGGPLAEPLLFYQTLNAALSENILPDGIQLFLTLPLEETEERLQERMRIFQALAKAEGLSVLKAEARAADIPRAAMTLIVSGVLTCEKRRPEAGEALLALGNAGESGALLLAEMEREQLLMKLPESYLEEGMKALEGARGLEEAETLPGAQGAAKGTEALPGALGVAEESGALKRSDFVKGLNASEAAIAAKEPLLPCLSLCLAASILREYGAVMQEVSEGGVLDALYRFSEGHSRGISVELGAVPITQHTVEITEALPEKPDPYTLFSAGCMLAALPEEKALEVLSRITALGIPAARIGKVCEGKKKELRLPAGTETPVRDLPVPAQDPLDLFPWFG